MPAQDGNGFIPVVRFAQPFDGAYIALDVGDKLVFMRQSPGSPRAANRLLVMTVSIPRVLQEIKTVGFCYEIEWRSQKGGGIFAFAHTPPARQGAAGGFDLVIAYLQSIAPEQIEQHERISRGQGIDRKGSAAQFRVVLDLGNAGDDREARAAAHEDE